MKPEFNEIPRTADFSAALPAERLTCGIQFLTDFWTEKYLREYIRHGGSKIKFITGRTGSGKTHFLRLMTSIAQKKLQDRPVFRKKYLDA
ncbi:BREX system ATP-binding domain-containing protein [Lachnospiraceae bacterium 46-15]